MRLGRKSDNWRDCIGAEALQSVAASRENGDISVRRLSGVRYRFYSPELGRYVSSDPIGLYGGMNLFGYANQNPNSYIDPNGHFGLIGAAAGFGIEMFLNYMKYGFKLDCYDWLDIGASTIFGGLAPGWLKVGKQGKNTAKKVRDKLAREKKYKRPKHKRKQRAKANKALRSFRDILLVQVAFQVMKKGAHEVFDYPKPNKIEFNEKTQQCVERCAPK